ncbi:hypothetical protein D0Z07_4697 [Hyphodiscus hymeniophilus]|uniref:Nucleic acid-binding protein n=1 Tax=Hyphodiscus hymeniophilus TaxID=353542 RepID=A0A9P7AX60_9HELO|nr:hypothetical protein D0Z07_4697 [Hyphodiscus hymeniophilus]
MAPKILVFTGAPLSAALDWDESSLVDTLCEPVARFTGFAHVDDASFVPATADTLLDNPSWRSIPLEKGHLATGLSQIHPDDQNHPGAAFFSASDIDSFIEDKSQPQRCESQASVVSVDQVLSQFYEQSYAIHEDIPSSQIVPTSDSGTSISSNETSSYRSSVESPWPKDIPNAGQLTNLKEVPNATYLNSIHPQTMTVNLIVGIISIPPPRSIKTRRGADVELIEVLAGDETKSGFTINFWLSSLQSADGDLRSVLSGLRPRDVVLIRNVALSSFRGKVFGQSLRREMTKAHLLYRSRIDRTDVGGCYSAVDLAERTMTLQAVKTKSVREWVLRFVGGGPASGPDRKTRDRVGAFKEVLPPDTQ